MVQLILFILVSANARADWPGENTQLNKAKEYLRQKGHAKKNIIVAVIDTGADLKHPEFKNRIWLNKKEIPDNSIDDDNNGYIDDVHGYNFAEENPDLVDSHGHGTHIAGIIAMHTNKSTRLMILKSMAPGKPSINSIKTTAAAIRYAVNMGAQIINYSAGGRRPDKEELSALNYALRNNVLVIAAAGNLGQNTDTHPYYPASYGLANIISVMSADQSFTLLKSSNFGKQSTDVAAPGKAILSTLPDGGYGLMTGTSQATAFVTATAALLLSSKKNDTSVEGLKSRILISTKSHLAQKHIQTWKALYSKESQSQNPALYSANHETLLREHNKLVAKSRLDKASYPHNDNAGTLLPKIFRGPTNSVRRSF